jgi:uncharacterized protein (TIGR03084 family)
MKKICGDLYEEYNSLDALVANLDDKQWNLKTPFFGWTIKDQISHIAYFDGTGLLSSTDPKAFMADFEEAVKNLKPDMSMYAQVNEERRHIPNKTHLDSWRKTRNLLIEALKVLNPKARLPWYGPEMSAISFATARIMEAWAHGQDVADTLKIRRTPTDRLKHIAFLGVTTFKWSFINRKMAIPEKEVRVILTSPSGKTWEWGPDDSDEIVKGSAEDFCLVVTQRRNIADTKIVTKGEIAKSWMTIAQAFAGPPEDGPKPGQRVIEY